MKEKTIKNVMIELDGILSKKDMDCVLRALTKVFESVDIIPKETAISTEFADNDFYINMYLTCKKLLGLQPNTIKAYRYEIKRFVDITGCNVAKVETNCIRQYLYNYQKNASNTSTDNIRRYLNCFFQFLVDENYINKNPMKQITKIKDNDKIVKFCTDYEVEQLRDACKTKRELALVDFLLSTGLRVHEVPKIKLSDIDWNKRIVLIHGKGGKDRVVPFSIRACKHLQDYLSTRGQNSIYLFCRTKTPYDKQPSKSMINDIFSRIRKNAGIDDATIHSIRRWMATHMNECGADASIIQDILGHASFSTTKKFYLDKNIKHISQIHDICAV